MLKKKRIISFMLILSMICNFLVTPEKAQASNVHTTVIDGISWTYTVGEYQGYATNVYPKVDDNVKTLTELTFPEKVDGHTVYSVGNASGTTWYNFENMVTVYLPDTVREIAIRGFESFGKLKAIYGKNVKKISGKGFYSCGNLETVYFPNLEVIGVEAFRGALCGDFIIPNTVTKIYPGAFYGSKMKRLEIHAKSPAPISSSGFGYNEIFGDNDDNMDGLSSDSYAFEGCGALTEVVIGKEVEYFFGEVFYNKTYNSRTFYFLSKDTEVIYSDNFVGSYYQGGYNKLTVVYEPTEEEEEDSTLEMWIAGKKLNPDSRVNSYEFYTLEQWKAKGKTIPSVTVFPEEDIKVNSITAEYNGTVVEGKELNPENVVITAEYTDYTTKTISGTESGVTFNTKTVSNVGENEITVTYGGKSAVMKVTGTTKTVTGITATLNEDYLSNVQGWNSTKKAFEIGSTLAPSMFKVMVEYDNGTYSELNSADFTLSKTTINKLEGNTITITQKNTGYVTEIVVTGYSEKLDSTMEDLGILEGNYEELIDKVTEITDELSAYEEAMKEIKDSLGMDGSSVSKDELDEITVNVAQKMEELKELEAGLEEMEEILAEIMGSESGEEATIEEIKQQLEDVHTRLDEAETKAEALTNFTDEIKAQLGLSEGATEEDIIQKIVEIQNDFENAKAEIELYEQTIIEINEALEKEESKNEELNSQKEVLSSEIANLTSQNTELNEQKASLESQLESLGNSYEEQTEELQMALDAVNSQIEENNKLLEEKVVLLEQLETQMKENESLKNQLSETIDKVKETVAELNTLKSELDRLEMMLNSGNFEDIPQDGHLAGILGKIEEINGELEETKEKADYLTQFATSLKDKLGLSKDATEEDILTEIDKLLKQLEDTETTSKEEIESLRTAILLMGQQNTDLRNEIAQLKGENSALVNEIAQLKTQNNSSSSSSTGSASSGNSQTVMDKLEYQGNMKDIAVNNSGTDEVVEVAVWYTSTGVMKSNSESYVLSYDGGEWSNKLDFSNQILDGTMVRPQATTRDSAYSFYLKNKNTGKITHYLIGDIVLDKEAPIVGMTSSNGKITAYKGQNTYNIFTNKEIKFKLDVDYGESGKDSIYYMIAYKGTSQNDNTWKKLSGKSLTVGSDVAARVIFKVIDKAGNVTKIKSKGFVIDTKAPVVSVTNGKTYTDALTVQFSDESGIKIAMLNGKNIKSGATVNTDGEYTLTVTDNAGNSVKSVFIIKKPVEVKPVVKQPVPVVTTPVKDVLETVEKPAEELKKEEVEKEVVEVVEKPVETEKAVVIKANVPEEFESDINLCYIGDGETLTETLTKTGNYQVKKEIESGIYSLFYANLGEEEDKGIYKLEAPEKFEVSESEEDVVFTVTKIAENTEEEAQESLEADLITEQINNESINGWIIVVILIGIIIVCVIVHFVVKKKKWNY